MADSSLTVGLVNVTGVSPTGQSTRLPVSGNAAKTTTALGAGGTWSTGWLDTSLYGGVETTIYSDVDGSYVISYSDDNGVTTVLPPITVNYLGTQGTRKGQFPSSATFIKFDYTNGSTAQTKFRFQVSLLTQPAQSSAETLSAMGSDTRTAQWTKSRIETKTSDGTNDYAPIYRTGNSLNVNVSNLPASQSVTQGTNPWVTRGDKAPTSATTLVSVVATTTTILAANTNRKGATIYAEGILYLLLGSGASQTNYSIRMTTSSYYEVPFNYTGIITGVGATVAVHATELT